MRSTMSSSMSTSSIKERVIDRSEEVADVSSAIACFLRGTDGMVTPLWKKVAITLERGWKGVVVGIPITMVAGATVRWTDVFWLCPSPVQPLSHWREELDSHLLPALLPIQLPQGQNKRGCCRGFHLHRKRSMETIQVPTTSHQMHACVYTHKD